MLCALFLVEALHFFNQAVGIAPTWAVFPFPAVAHAPGLVVHPYGAASLYAGRLAPFHTCHQQIKTLTLFADATIEILEGYAVLESARLDKISGRNLSIRGDEAITEAKVYHRVCWVEVCGAQRQHVAQAFARTMHAVY